MVLIIWIYIHLIKIYWRIYFPASVTWRTNSTCHQFTAALKTVVVNSLASPKRVARNYEEDNCTPLDASVTLLKFSRDTSTETQEQLAQTEEVSMDFISPELEDLPVEDTQGLAYVAGWVLKNIDTPDCDN
jgi:hypothetical protein